MNDNPWPGYPVLNYTDLFLRTYMVIIIIFGQVLISELW